MKVYNGKSVFSGIAIGKISVYKKGEQQVKRTKISDTDAELARYESAKEEAAKQLQGLYDKALKEVGEANAAIFEVHQMMLEDIDYNESVENIVRSQEVNVEYGADVYVDMISGKCTSIFVKKKIKMRAGETDKSVSVKNPELFELIRKFVEKCGFCGMIDIDLFEIGGVFYISEVNPRFGGGYPHAYACGVNMPSQVLCNLSGRENPVRIGEYKENVCMMKYNEIAVRDFEGEQIVE